MMETVVDLSGPDLHASPARCRPLLAGLAALLAAAAAAAAGRAEDAGNDAASSPPEAGAVFPYVGASLRETLESASTLSKELTNVAVKRVVVLRTDVEPWIEIPVEDLLRGRSPAPTGASYAVTSTRACRAVVGFHMNFATTTSWYLLPEGRLRAYEHHRLDDSCLTKLFFEPATGDQIVLEEEVVERLGGLEFQRSMRPLDAYRKGFGYAKVGRIREARRMLELGDAAFSVRATRDLRSKSRRKGVDIFAPEEKEQLRAELVRMVDAAEEVATSPDPSPSALVDVARLHAGHDEIPQAQERMEEAIESIAESEGPESIDLAGPLVAAGRLYGQQGNSERARALLEQALELQREHLSEEDVTVAVTLGSLAAIELQDGRLEEADRYSSRALSIATETLDEDDANLARILTVRGQVEQGQGDPAESERLLRRSLAIHKRNRDRMGQMSVEYSLAVLQMAGGRFPEARRTLDRLLERAEASLDPSHPALSDTLDLLAFLAARDGDADRYVELQTRSNRISNLFARSLLSAGTERDWALSLAAQDSQTFATVFFSLGFDTPRTHRLAFSAVLQRKGRLLDNARTRLQTLLGRMDPSDAFLLDQLAEIRSAISQLSLGADGGEPAEDVAAELSRLRKAAERLEGDISKSATDALDVGREIAVEEVATRIPTGGALIEYVSFEPFGSAREQAAPDFGRRGPRRYAACVLTPAALPRCVDLGEAGPIDRRIAELLAADTDARADPKPAARDLHRLLLEPLRSFLADARFLIIAPDAELNLVPFGALVDETGRYLIESFTFDYLSSGRDLLPLPGAAARPGPPVLLGDPDFEWDAVQRPRLKVPGVTVSGWEPLAVPDPDLSRLDVGPLPGTRLEVERIATILHGATQLVGSLATEQALRQARSPHVLHLATHSFLVGERRSEGRDGEVGERALSLRAHGSARDDPLLRAGLALAGFNHRRGGWEDGALTALEASSLPLAGTNLVVLSACETGLGELVSGEGVYGLRRAFSIAGARSQVTSLWKVADLATSQLMTDYYRRLVDGEPRAEALRSAQLEMLKRSEWGHPFYWAAFVPSGEWQPLEPWVSVASASAEEGLPLPEAVFVEGVAHRPSDYFEIVQVELAVAERREDAWLFQWSIQVRNRSDRDLTLDAGVELLDDHDAAVKETTERGLELGPGTERVFSGVVPVPAAEARRITGLDADVRLTGIAVEPAGVAAPARD
jgi:CHAT domain-containing protein/tetratricopeptide (TPR) repeat protein